VESAECGQRVPLGGGAFEDQREHEALVAAGYGIALLPRYTMDVSSGCLVRRPLSGLRAARNVEAVLRTGAAGRPAVATVLSCLKESVPQPALH